MMRERIKSLQTTFSELNESLTWIGQPQGEDRGSHLLRAARLGNENHFLEGTTLRRKRPKLAS